jgi:hypothetical protein
MHSFKINNNGPERISIEKELHGIVTEGAWETGRIVHLKLTVLELVVKRNL